MTKHTYLTPLVRVCLSKMLVGNHSYPSIAYYRTSPKKSILKLDF